MSENVTDSGNPDPNANAQSASDDIGNVTEGDDGVVHDFWAQSLDDIQALEEPGR
jgi:hypothetical protein